MRAREDSDQVPASGLMLAGVEMQRVEPTAPLSAMCPDKPDAVPTIINVTAPQLVLGHRYQGGKAISQLQRRQRPSEFCQFLDTIEANVPPELEAYLVMDNFATHKTAAIQR